MVGRRIALARPIEEKERPVLEPAKSLEQSPVETEDLAFTANAKVSRVPTDEGVNGIFITKNRSVEPPVPFSLLNDMPNVSRSFSFSGNSVR